MYPKNGKKNKKNKQKTNNTLDTIKVAEKPRNIQYFPSLPYKTNNKTKQTFVV